MSKYYIHLIFLENCGYSQAAKDLLDNYKVEYDKTIVERSNIENYKTELIKTFPQIYLKKKKK